MVEKAENGHVNIYELFKFNFIATYNIGHLKKILRKIWFCAKKVTTLPHLTVPGKYLSWLVYSEMKARWRCWRPEVGGETLCRAKMSGL